MKNSGRNRGETLSRSMTIDFLMKYSMEWSFNYGKLNWLLNHVLQREEVGKLQREEVGKSIYIKNFCLLFDEVCYSERPTTELFAVQQQPFTFEWINFWLQKQQHTRTRSELWGGDAKMSINWHNFKSKVKPLNLPKSMFLSHKSYLIKHFLI